MEITVLIFGQLAELVGTHELKLNGYDTTNELESDLHQRYPRLSESKYRLAVNKKLVSTTASLAAGDVVALLPPFSGG